MCAVHIIHLFYSILTWVFIACNNLIKIQIKKYSTNIFIVLFSYRSHAKHFLKKKQKAALISWQVFFSDPTLTFYVNTKSIPIQWWIIITIYNTFKERTDGRTRWSSIAHNCFLSISSYFVCCRLKYTKNLFVPRNIAINSMHTTTTIHAPFATCICSMINESTNEINKNNSHPFHTTFTCINIHTTHHSIVWPTNHDITFATFPYMYYILYI